ncbi:helix-turn-helix domain-containing protein [Paenibacillus allorhizosphaerae]|uniref:HTH-type transcriptional activator RhaS n=1 Tax=Paenibacillus allorhizosphaerae TaxID=2849866 RepID=A0ABM8VP43_9BACL|nr:helix-turn-helix domain-containing protein [Paenibacillus allorhizosphaerae]CAG7652315.1 HTH-type transcriptional activator RhaS [Paenibacillus allorhizosphaerae]
MLKLPINTNSLFFKSIVSFLTIILLLASFNFLSFTFFKTNIQQEIIRNNRLTLKNTADRYEKHLAIIRSMLFKLYQNEDVVAFGRQLAEGDPAQVNFLKPADMIKSIRSEVNNPFLYLDNVIILYRSASFTVDKNGTGDASRLFSRFYVSEPYSAQYWQKQFESPNTTALHPGASFSIVSSDQQSRELIPMTVKLPSYNHMIIGMLDAERLFESFHGADNPQLLILHDNGSTIFNSSDRDTAETLPLMEGNDFIVSDNRYYFYHRSDETNLTYVTVVPYSAIAAQIQRLEWTLFFLFVVSVLIAGAASVIFSRKLNHPVMQIIASLRRRSPEVVRSSIHEFALIGDISRELIRERNEFHSDLQSNQSLLTDYNYINRLKMIKSGSADWKDTMVHNRPFRIVLFQLYFRSAAPLAAQMKPDRLTYAVRECIDLVLSGTLDKPRTLQMESNQLLSVLFGEQSQDQLEQTLSRLKTIFDQDKAYYLVSAAVGSLYPIGSDFNRAYIEVLERAKQAKLLDETQLIWDDAPAASHFVFTAEQEQELYVNMQEGNGSTCEQSVGRMLDNMFRKEASRLQFRAFAQNVSVKMLKIAERAKVEPKQWGMLNDMLDELEECCTLEEYKRYFERFLSSAAQSIKAKRDEKDPVVDFFAVFLEEHYSEDLSLDAVADRMNMSSSYLSVYIKEKTGTNFSDHLNNVRIRKAKELLLQSDRSVQEIGERIGYRNVTSFIRMFKKITGLTPGDYRKRGALEARGEG